MGLKQDRVPNDCKEIKGNYPIDMQTTILWARTDLYKDEMPVLAKNAQSFNCHGEKGTVYQFQFATDAQRTSSAHFVKVLLWGEPEPNEEHPELVPENGSVFNGAFVPEVPALIARHLSALGCPSSSGQSGN